MSEEVETAQAAAERNEPKERVLWYLGQQLFMCHYCMTPIDEKTATIDHIVPVKNGGTIDDGIVLACRRCNGTRAAFDYYAFMALIDAIRPPVIVKNRRNYGRPHLGVASGRQQIELNRIWQIRRGLHREHKTALMPSADLLHARRIAFEEEMRAQNPVAEFVEAAE